MKRSVFVTLFLMVGVSLFLLVGCQTKEVTSAKVYIQQDDWDKALEQLEQAIKLYPGDPEAHMLLGRGYGKKGWYAKMADEFRQSLAISPQFSEDIKRERQFYWGAEFNNGVKSYNESHIDQATLRFATCILIDSTRMEAYKNLAATLSRMDSIDKAISITKLLLKKDPKNFEAMVNLATSYKNLKQYDDQIAMLLKARELQPNNTDLVGELGIAYHVKGDTAKAFQIYQEALQQTPDNVDLLFNLGRLYTARGQYQNAIFNFEKIIAATPEDFESYLLVGENYVRYADSLSSSLKAKEEKENKEYPAERAQLKEVYRKATPYFEKGLELKPDHANGWYWLFRAYYLCDEKEKGEQAYKKYEELNKTEK